MLRYIPNKYLIFGAYPQRFEVLFRAFFVLYIWKFWWVFVTLLVYIVHFEPINRNKYKNLTL